MDSSLSPQAAAPTTTAIGMRYGLLTGLVGIVFSLALNLTNMQDSDVRWLGMAITITGLWLAHAEYKKQNGGFMEYGQGLSIGMVLSAVSGLLNGVFMYVYTAFVDPKLMAGALEKSRAQMEAKGNMSEEQIEQGLAMAAKFMTPGALFIITIIFSLIMGLVLSLIMSAITKNSRPEFE
ncbi:MAG: DUF4199 domain-containing protein [Hymenobacteraceae bacterium]|nr:DUF4199 domain-containing protein [Hymenobacteraceae bacterium]